MLKKMITATVLSASVLMALPNDEASLLMVNKAVEKKVVVLSNMGLDGDTKIAFGKMYDEYQMKLIEQRMAEIELINNYALNYNKMTEDNANKIITQWSSVEETQLKLKQEYIKKFKKVMGSADVIRYFQIENRLALMGELQAASIIPLAQPAMIEPTTVN